MHVHAYSNRGWHRSDSVVQYTERWCEPDYCTTERCYFYLNYIFMSFFDERLQIETVKTLIDDDVLGCVFAPPPVSRWADT